MRTPSGFSGNTGKGFTIVELLVVVVVIAILAAITIVSYNGISSRALQVSLDADVRNVSIAMEQYKVENGTYPPINSGAASAPDLEKIIRDANLITATRTSTPNSTKKTFVFCRNDTNSDYIVIAVQPLINISGGVANPSVVNKVLTYRASGISGEKKYTSDNTSWLRGQNLCHSVGGSTYSGSNNYRWSHDIPTVNS